MNIRKFVDSPIIKGIKLLIICVIVAINSVKSLWIQEDACDITLFLKKKPWKKNWKNWKRSALDKIMIFDKKLGVKYRSARICSKALNHKITDEKQVNKKNCWWWFFW